MAYNADICNPIIYLKPFIYLFRQNSWISNSFIKTIVDRVSYACWIRSRINPNPDPLILLNLTLFFFVLPYLNIDYIQIFTKNKKIFYLIKSLFVYRTNYITALSRSLDSASAVRYINVNGIISAYISISNNLSIFLIIYPLIYLIVCLSMLSIYLSYRLFHPKDWVFCSIKNRTIHVYRTTPEKNGV